MSDSQHVSEQVARLRAIETLTVAFLRSPKAVRHWKRHNPSGDEFPSVYILASGGFQDATGLVIGGSWESDDGWDFDSVFTLFTDHGDILTCHGWNLDIEVL
ncbi:hypothetical protein HN018_24280 (plasmid) [Lichenicola cladoniae]|uniref:Uncharacterized protein n=1 Tax=Lichenicola cladoniae TaxID=1484109 RepID=A0A6M8HYB6_9PROT|nr:hypothetical protein [Lichenicola cladoniae]NPD70270.1 hypothetical protein [Acetobacteraceae bacterium]QKE93330.1 hypothetical protein HN018_24280 [Lichenicola cladoniae]